MLVYQRVSSWQVTRTGPDSSRTPPGPSALQGPPGPSRAHQGPPGPTGSPRPTAAPDARLATHVQPVRSIANAPVHATWRQTIGGVFNWDTIKKVTYFKNALNILKCQVS